MTINDSKTVPRLVQEERKACRGFGGEERRIVKQRTWQRSVIGIERSSFKSDTVEIIGARWRGRLVWKEKGKLTLWASLEAARDDSSMNLN